MKKIFLLITTFIITISTLSKAQTFNEVVKLVASDRGQYDSFGWSMDISGNYAIVGSVQDGEDAAGGNMMQYSGSAYIFKKSTDGLENWTLVKKIVASDRGAFNNFGYSVSIDGDYVIVGARRDDKDVTGGNVLSRAGSAYIFKKDEGGADNWGEVKKIVASDRNSNDEFGWDVSISGDYAVVGAIANDVDANGQDTVLNAGAAYVFKKDASGMDNWGEIKKVVADDRGTLGAAFGRALDISNNYLVIGARVEDKDATGQNPLVVAGAAYVFEKDEGGVDNWGEIQKVVASDREIADYFGNSVAISTDYLVVGAHFKDDTTNNLDKAGAAYIFKKDVNDTWTQIKKLTASDANEDNYFGESVALSDDYIAVGAHFRNDTINNLNQVGGVYLFKKDEGGVDNWGETQLILRSDGAANDNFGWKVAISGDDLLVSSRYEDKDATGTNPITNAGAAFVYRLDFVLNTSQFINNSNLKIFPNPVQNQLTIEHTETIEQVIIYNSIGQLVRQITHPNVLFQIDVTDLSSGFYIIEARQANGQRAVRQFIKQ